MNATAYYWHRKHHIKSFILLRWLVLLVAAYLAWFSSIVEPPFPGFVTFLAVFAVSNILCMLAPRETIESRPVRHSIMISDIIFAAITFYFLRDSSTYFYVAFAVAFAVGAVWRNLTFSGLSFVGIGVVYSLSAMGPFNTFNDFAKGFSSNERPVLTLSLFYVVDVVYLFLADRLRHDATLSMVLLEEKRRSDVMAEITRSLTSSLQSQEVLHLIARKISEVFDAAECAIVRPGEDGRSGRVLVRASIKGIGELEMPFDKHPELRQALVARDLLFVPRVETPAAAQSVVVIPLVVRETLLGLIHIRLRVVRIALDEADARFIKMVSLTAANALRNAQLFEEMEHMARTDFMTGLSNHRFFQETLAAEFIRAQRHNHPLSLLMLDLDHLKQVNDRFGHPAGDAVIRGVAQMIRASCRDFDVAARYGGEEFAVILPETQLAGALMVAERIRERIHFMDIAGVDRVTASIGVSNFPQNAASKEDLIQAADHALYQAKESGRDRVSHITNLLRDRA